MFFTFWPFQNSERSHSARCQTSFHTPVIVSVVDAVCVLHHGLRSKWPNDNDGGWSSVTKWTEKLCEEKNARSVNGNLTVLKSL